MSTLAYITDKTDNGSQYLRLKLTIIWTQSRMKRLLCQCVELTLQQNINADALIIMYTCRKDVTRVLCVGEMESNWICIALNLHQTGKFLGATLNFVVQKINN